MLARACRCFPDNLTARLRVGRGATRRTPHGNPFRTWQNGTGSGRFLTVLAVVAQKIRGSRQGSTSTVGRVYEGYLLSEPLVGRGMVLFRDPNGRRMVTTAVRRILGGSDDGVLYVETENSVYRIVMGDGLAAAADKRSHG